VKQLRGAAVGIEPPKDVDALVISSEVRSLEQQLLQLEKMRTSISGLLEK